MSDSVKLVQDGFEVGIARLGAELQSIRDPSGKEWMWNGDPAFWPRHAPVLFPIVGRAANDALVVDGKSYPMAQHGFARDSVFEVIEQSADACLLRLTATDATRAIYPFDFVLDLAYRLEGGALHQAAILRNAGKTAMAASVGYHPAFVWPAAPPALRTAHIVRFEKPEPAPLRRLAGGRVAAQTIPTPVEGDVLHLRDDLFEHDALIFDRLASRSVWFGLPGSPGVRVDFPGLPFFGLWTKPGAGFLCIEPWNGHHAPEGFDGDIFAMPGMIAIAPGESATRAITIRCGVTEG